jgi:hypothetical protein
MQKTWRVSFFSEQKADHRPANNPVKSMLLCLGLPSVSFEPILNTETSSPPIAADDAPGLDADLARRWSMFSRA